MREEKAINLVQYSAQPHCQNKYHLSPSMICLREPRRMALSTLYTTCNVECFADDSSFLMDQKCAHADGIHRPMKPWITSSAWKQASKWYPAECLGAFSDHLAAKPIVVGYTHMRG